MKTGMVRRGSWIQVGSAAVWLPAERMCGIHNLGARPCAGHMQDAVLKCKWNLKSGCVKFKWIWAQLEIRLKCLEGCPVTCWSSLSV